MRKFKLGVLALGAALAVGVGAGIALRSNKAVSVSAADENWVETPITSLATNDVVVVVDKTTSKAMANDGGTSSAPSAVAVTLNSDKSAITSTVADKTKWTMTVSGSSYKFGTGSNFLYCTNTNNGMRVGTNSNNQFVIDSNFLKNSGTSRYIGVYNSQDWRCYTSINNNIKDTVVAFYKLTSGSTKTLTGISVTGTMQTTEYLVGQQWNPAGINVTGTYDDDSQEDVTSKVSWSYNPAVPALGVTSVTVTATLGDYSASTDPIAVSVTKVNPLQTLYTLSANDPADVYGYFVGNKDGNNIIIMDGDYGIDVYQNGLGTNSYVENETILHVVGKVSIYNGLYEIASISTIEVVESADISTPVTYSAKGGETADYASRTTTVTGVPTVTKGDITAEAGTADITLSFALGEEKTVQVYYKKATQTDDAACYAALADAVANSSEITVKGFTAWYNGFQVQMTGYIPASEDYTALLFAQDLLAQTNAVCDGYQEGDDNHDALVLIWNDLASNDKYPSLPADQKTILAEAERNESGTDIEKAMARYDFLTGKYNLNNFINGRTPIVTSSIYHNPAASNANVNVLAIIIIASVALVTTTGAITAIIIKKRVSR